ncbi:FG-GAP repeat protein, partial [Streptomyces sp. NPDC006415]
MSVCGNTRSTGGPRSGFPVFGEAVAVGDIDGDGFADAA